MTSAARLRIQNEGGWADGKAVSELEAALGWPEFRGANAGSMLGDLFVLSLVNGNASWPAANILLDYARCCYHAVRGLRSGNRPYSVGSGKYLITSIDPRPNLTGLIFPAMDYLGHGNCAVIGKATVQSLLPKAVDFLPWEAMPAIDMSEWRRAWLPCVRPWFRTLVNFRKRWRIPHGFIPEALDWTAVQTQRVLSYERLLDALRPAAILTESDHNSLVAPLMIAARTRGVPTITLVHGVANAHFAPLLADKVCCWGQLDRDLFLRHGVAPERIAITGYTRMRREAPEVGPERKRSIVGSSPRYTAIFASSPLPFDTKRKLARDFCEAVSLLPDTAALIRLHPSERVSEYAEVSNQYPAVKFLANDACTLDEAVAITDVVAVHVSGFGNDALMKGRPVVVLNSVPGESPNAEDLITLGGCPSAHTPAELSALLATMITDSSARTAALERAEEYVRNRCAFYGPEAAERVAEVVRSCATGGHWLGHAPPDGAPRNNLAAVEEGR